MNSCYLWFDFENAPHVWILSPIIRYFRKKGYSCILTARNFSYTVDLCQHLGYDIQVVGHSGMAKSKQGKVMRILDRSVRLYKMLYHKRRSIAFAISHGSRSQLLAAYGLRIPALCMDDYEFSYQGFSRFADCLLVPFPIEKEIWSKRASKVVHYPGLKEELYLYGFDPTNNCLPEYIKAGHQDVMVLFRPSGTWSHYKSSQSVITQQGILEYLSQYPEVYLILLPRDKFQKEEITSFCVKRGMRFYVPEQILDGPQLIWQMDLVISGGGTMSREAAVLGVPSYSFFGGQWGGVDRHLESRGMLVSVKHPDDIRKVVIKKRDRIIPRIGPQALDFVTSFIEKKLDYG